MFHTLGIVWFIVGSVISDDSDNLPLGFLSLIGLTAGKRSRQ